LKKIFWFFPQKKIQKNPQQSFYGKKMGKENSLLFLQEIFKTTFLSNLIRIVKKIELN